MRFSPRHFAGQTPRMRHHSTDRRARAAKHFAEYQFEVQSVLRLLLCRPGRLCRGADGSHDVDDRQQAVPRLLAVGRAGPPITVGFLGGEPFANRGLIHQTGNYASAEGPSAPASTCGSR